MQKNNEQETQDSIAATRNPESHNMDTPETGSVSGVSRGVAANEHDTKMRDESQASEACDNYFGVCPICGKTDGYINIGKAQWFYCKEHRVSWWIGSLLSSWIFETEAEQMAKYDELGFGSFRIISAGDARMLPIPDFLRESEDSAGEDTKKSSV